MEFSVEKFNEVKRGAEDFYNKIGAVYCPYFGQDVHFNAKGFDHLIFKGFNRTRLIQDQFSRLRHIRFAPEIIKLSKTLQGHLCINKIERIRRNTKWEKVMRKVTYYEFISVMESNGSRIRFKVLVKQVEGTEKHFLSIIPFWGTNKTTGERVIHSGNPESD